MAEITKKPQTKDAPEHSDSASKNSIDKAYKLYSKIKIFDTIFKLFFEDDENVRQLYESLSNRKIRAEDIERITLEEGKSFDSQLRNDLSFIVKNEHAQDEFVILTEAQSTWNKSMAYRFWEYNTAIFRKYVTDHHLDSQEDEFCLPRPRFYLIYTGEGARPRKLKFSNVYGPVKTDSYDLDFGIHVISSASSKTLPGEYIGFCNLVKDLRSEHRDYVKFVDELRKKCIKKRYAHFEKFIDDHKEAMEHAMEQEFRSEKEFRNFMTKRDKIVGDEAVRIATPEIKQQTIIELYTEHLISVEAAANKLNMTVPEFEEFLKTLV